MTEPSGQTDRERRRDLARRVRFEAAKNSRLDRLRRVCQDWPRQEVEMLAARLTRLQLKYDAWQGPRRAEP